MAFFCTFLAGIRYRLFLFSLGRPLFPFLWYKVGTFALCDSKYDVELAQRKIYRLDALTSDAFYQLQ